MPKTPPHLAFLTHSTHLVHIPAAASGNRRVLDRIGNEVEQRLRDGVRGATSVSRSWTMDNQEIGFRDDPEKLALYPISPTAVAMQLQGAVRGMPGSVFRIPNQDGPNIWMQLGAAQREHSAQPETYPIQTPEGPVPLAQLGTLDRQMTASVITRQSLQRTLDIEVYRSRRPISHMQEDVMAALQGIHLPPG